MTRLVRIHSGVLSCGMTCWARAAVVVALTYQASPLSVPTIGEPDVVTRLNETDIALIKERAHNSCPTLLLIQAIRSQLTETDSQTVSAYCASTPSPYGALYLRRGSYVRVSKRPASPWQASGTGQYTQVTDTPAGDELAGVRDIRRPFRVSGSLTDVELVSLVTYLRSSPPGPPPVAKLTAHVEGGWPISGVWKRDDGSVEVAFAESDGAAQLVKLRFANQQWEIVSIGLVVA